MRTVLSVICVLLLSPTNGQVLYFSDTSNVWTYLCVDDLINPQFFYNEFSSYSGDTVLDGRKYSVLNSLYQSSEAFVRDDTAARRVWMYVDDSTEQLLYDYDLSIGDTIVARTNFNTFYNVLFDTSSIILNNIYHRVQEFHPVDSTGSSHLSYWVYEGIGALNNPLYPLMPAAIEHYCSFCKLENSGATYWEAGSCTVSTAFRKNPEINVEVYPNPVGGECNFDWKRPCKAGRLDVYDVLGRSCMQRDISGLSKANMEMSELSPGIYYYRVQIDAMPVVKGYLIKN